MTSDEKTLSVLERGTVDLISEKELKEKLSLDRPLRIKLGVDPTSPDLHLGHAVVLDRMRAFQDLGHTGVLIIGDFTARLGDPSGQDKTRPVLSPATIRKNADTYTKQAFGVLLPDRTEIRFNSEWLSGFVSGSRPSLESSGTEQSAQQSRAVTGPSPEGSLRGKGNGAPEMFSILSRLTVSRLLEREDFKNRMRAENPITMLEILYPVLQGYDSVAVKADVELGGADQIFNLLMGRDIQRDYHLPPQVVLTLPLLVGTDGSLKMSKSYGNHIALTDSPQDMFGKVMSVSDELMMSYYELLTGMELSAVKKMHPMEAKKQLAEILVSRFHSKDAATAAKTHFERVFSRKETPRDMPVFRVKPDTPLSRVIFSSGLARSMNEARRLIKQDAVRLDGEKITEDKPLTIGRESVLQVGRRRGTLLVSE